MKQLQFLILMLCSLFLLNCNNDDDNSPTPTPEILSQPTSIHVERHNIIGTPQKTYFLEYNDNGKITSISTSSETDRVDHTILYEGERITKVIYNSPGGPTTTSFEYDEDTNKISNVEETGPEARIISDFNYFEDDNSYHLSIEGIGSLTIYAAFDSQDHILWYKGKLVSFLSDRNGVFSSHIGNVAPLYLTLPTNAIYDLYYFSQYEIQFSDLGTSATTFDDYTRNNEGNITSFTRNLSGTEAYLEYTLLY